MDVSHERAGTSYTDEWLTPRWLIELLRPFDLDPAAPVKRPWETAAHHYTILDDGLRQPWHGFVWLNPPYSRVEAFMRRMAEHKNGIALVYCRPGTRWFQQYVFRAADAVCFLRGRLRFVSVDGTPAKNSAGADSVLVGYGQEAVRRLETRCRRIGFVARLARLEAALDDDAVPPAGLLFGAVPPTNDVQGLVDEHQRPGFDRELEEARAENDHAAARDMESDER